MEVLVCPECKEKSVEKEQHSGQDQLVCKECGTIYSKSDFFDYSTTCGQTFVDKNSSVSVKAIRLPWAIAKEQFVKTPCGVKCGLESIETLASGFSLPSYMKTSAVDLFKDSVRSKEFIASRIEKKKALAAVCVYYSLRTGQWPVTIQSFCELLDIGLHNFNDVLKTLLQIMNTSLLTTPVEDLISIYLKDYTVNDAKQLISKTTALLEVSRNVWVIHGKKPEGVLSAAVYMAWMSLDIKSRNNYSYNKFCGATNLRNVNSATARYKELATAIKQLASHLPWLRTKTLSKSELLYHLENVLKYSRTLLMRSLQDKINDSCEEQPPVKMIRLDTLKEPEQTVSNSAELTENDIPEHELGKYIRSSEEVDKLKEFIKV